MRKYIYETYNTKIVVIDPEKYRKGNNNDKIKAIFEIYKKSKKHNKKDWRKTATHLIPRGILKRLGVAIQKNDQKEIKESGEVCLLECD